MTQKEFDILCGQNGVTPPKWFYGKYVPRIIEMYGENPFDPQFFGFIKGFMKFESAFKEEHGWTICGILRYMLTVDGGTQRWAAQIGGQMVKKMDMKLREYKVRYEKDVSLGSIPAQIG